MEALTNICLMLDIKIVLVKKACANVKLYLLGSHWTPHLHLQQGCMMQGTVKFGNGHELSCSPDLPEGTTCSSWDFSWRGALDHSALPLSPLTWGLCYFH